MPVYRYTLMDDDVKALLVLQRKHPAVVTPMQAQYLAGVYRNVELGYGEPEERALADELEQLGGYMRRIGL